MGRRWPPVRSPGDLWLTPASWLVSLALRVRRGCWNEIKKTLTGTSRDQGFPPKRWLRPVSGRSRRCDDLGWPDGVTTMAPVAWGR